MSRWDLLQAFVHVVEAGSFAAAAEKLDVSRSLLSKKVTQLERQLSTQLLVRTTRRLSTTDAGQTLFHKCGRLFSDLMEAEESVQNLEVVPRGHLRIVCTDVLGEQYIAKAAAEICGLHPQLKVDVHVTMRKVDLIAEGYDLAIRYGGLDDSSLKARKVYELPHVVCASPAYFKKSGTPRCVEELRQHNCIVATFDPCATWCFRVDGRDVSIDLDGNWRSNNGSALITAALEGVGICRLPVLYVKDHLASGRLVPILEDCRSDPLPVWMVYPNARYVPAKVRLFIDHFCDNMQRWSQMQPVGLTPSAPA